MTISNSLPVWKLYVLFLFFWYLSLILNNIYTCVCSLWTHFSNLSFKKDKYLRSIRLSLYPPDPIFPSIKLLIFKIILVLELLWIYFSGVFFCFCFCFLYLICLLIYFHGCTHDIWKFSGQGLNLNHGSNLWCSCGNTGSLNPRCQVGDWTPTSRVTQATAVGFLTHCTTVGTLSVKRFKAIVTINQSNPIVIFKIR